MDNSVYIKDLIEANEHRLSEIRKSLKTAPRGNLLIRNRKGRMFFARKFGNKEKGITKDRDLAVELMRKKMLLAETLYLEESLRALESALAKMKRAEMERGKATVVLPAAFKQLAITKAEARMTRQAYLWMKEQQGNKDYFPKELNFVTKGGVRVRSKSEKIIGDKLEEMGIAYRYEEPVMLPDGHVYYPDFTIIAANGKKIYWEHFGKLDDKEYLEKMAFKIRNYAKNGITPGNNLIITFESDIVSLENIENLIKSYLL